jgi:hypothetical protein
MTTVETDSVTANGILFHHLAMADGPLLLCLHRFPDHSHSFHSQQKCFSLQGYRVCRALYARLSTDRDAGRRDLLCRRYCPRCRRISQMARRISCYPHRPRLGARMRPTALRCWCHHGRSPEDQSEGPCDYLAFENAHAHNVSPRRTRWSVKEYSGHRRTGYGVAALRM